MRGALLIALVIAGVGCGAGQSASGATPDTQLTISFWDEGREMGKPEKWVLRCDPAGGTLPRSTTACRQLDRLTKPFAPIRKDVICTDQYGGPQQAVIAGTYKGNRVWALLAARNGCEIARAKRLGFLVPGFSAGAGGA